MKFMGDKEDTAPPPPKNTKNDKETQRLESQYDIIVPELYPLIAQQHQMKLEEEEDPYEKVNSFFLYILCFFLYKSIEKNERTSCKSNGSYSSISKKIRLS
jgi:hypothetical protein